MLTIVYDPNFRQIYCNCSHCILTEFEVSIESFNSKNKKLGSQNRVTFEIKDYLLPVTCVSKFDWLEIFLKAKKGFECKRFFFILIVLQTILMSQNATYFVHFCIYAPVFYKILV